MGFTWNNSVGRFSAISASFSIYKQGSLICLQYDYSSLDRTIFQQFSGYIKAYRWTNCLILIKTLSEQQHLDTIFWSNSLRIIFAEHILSETRNFVILFLNCDSEKYILNNVQGKFSFLDSVLKASIKCYLLSFLQFEWNKYVWIIRWERICDWFLKMAINW